MVRSIEPIMRFVSSSTDVEKLHVVRDRAQAYREATLVNHVDARLVALAIEQGLDPIEPAFDTMLKDNRKILGFPRQRTINWINDQVAGGVVRRDAIVKKLSDWALVKGTRNGFEGLKNAGRLGATGEALILRFSNYFPSSIVDAAKRRLVLAGWHTP